MPTLSELKCDECCVCYEKTKHKLCCANDHYVCLKCLQKMLHHCPCVGIGIGWQCPMCREYLMLEATQLLAIGFGSHKIVTQIKHLDNDY